MDRQYSPGPLYPVHFGQNQCNNTPKNHTSTIGQTGYNCGVEQLCKTTAAPHISCHGNPYQTEPTQPSPRLRIVKPADITYAEATKQNDTRQQRAALTVTTTTNTTIPVLTQSEPFDYQATLDRITKDVKTNLKAKFDTAIANLQKSFTNLEEKVNQKIQHHMEFLKNLQANKDTQVTHMK